MTAIGNVDAWGNEIELTNMSSNWQGAAFGIYPGQEYFFNLNHEQDFLKAYKLCAPLKAIISKRAMAFNSGRLIVRNVNTGKEATGRKEMYALLAQPNVLQSGEQFFAQQNTYLDVFGFCPVLTIKPVGFSHASSIWNIPPWLFDIEYTNQWLGQYAIDGIFRDFYINWNGTRMKLDMNNVKLIFDTGIGTQLDSNLLIPDSRLVGLEYPVSNTVAAYKSRNTLITKRGAIGIISNESEDESGNVAMRPGEKETLQKDFTKYGLVGQPFQIIISDAKLKWQQMGFPTSELMLFEEVQDNIDRLCDAYGWPAELMSRSKDTTFDNKKQARKDCYTNTIIPENRGRLAQFTRIIQPDDLAIVIDRDYTPLDIFAEDKKLKLETDKIADEVLIERYNNNLITRNQWREVVGLPRVEGDDVLRNDAKGVDPLAVKLGVVGTTALMTLIADVNISPETKQQGLVILFGMTIEDAKRLVPDKITIPQGITL